jgi:hypothetical protein
MGLGRDVPRLLLFLRSGAFSSNRQVVHHRRPNPLPRSGPPPALPGGRSAPRGNPPDPGVGETRSVSTRPPTARNATTIPRGSRPPGDHDHGDGFHEGRPDGKGVFEFSSVTRWLRVRRAKGASSMMVADFPPLQRQKNSIGPPVEEKTFHSAPPPPMTRNPKCLVPFRPVLPASPSSLPS